MSAVNSTATVSARSRSRPEHAEMRLFRHELAPGRSITIDVRNELQLEGDKLGRYSVVAVMELGRQWEEPTQEDLDFEFLRADLAGEEPTSPATNRAAYQLLWFGSKRVPRTTDGSYRPFAHAGMLFQHPVAIMGEEFLGRDAHGRQVTSGCRAIARTGQWVNFGPGTMQGLMDFPDRTSPVAFAVGIDPENEHLVQIVNRDSLPISIACGTPEVDQLPEEITGAPEA